MKETMNIVIVGHVDHGKSTVVGRLLADTNSLPEGKLESVKRQCEINSKPFEYAFLLDALKDEQSQGITIDSARVFFYTDKRHYIIIDAPGHIEFLKNMITGASRAESALLVIDAAEGVKENSRRHAYMLSMLGIDNIVVLINKMDLIGYDQKHFETLEREFTDFLKGINIVPHYTIPVSGFEGVNIAKRSGETSWYTGPTVLEALDSFARRPSVENAPFRMPVQDIYKFTNFGDSRRIVAGTVISGQVKVGDEVIFLPSGKKSRVKSLERFHAPVPEHFYPEESAGFTLEEQIYVTRGELAVRSDEKIPEVSSNIRTSLFWLSRNPMELKKDYLLKVGTAKVQVRLEEIHGIIDASSLEGEVKDRIERHDVADCTLKLREPIAFDLDGSIPETSRFVIVDNYDIAGGGIVRSVVADKSKSYRDHIMVRNYKWEKGKVSMSMRADRYNQRPTLILITGGKEIDKKTLAKDLENRLFQNGKIVYYLGIGNVKYGVDADIAQDTDTDPNEHIRRLAEIIHILMDSGMILIVTATNLTQEHLEIIKASVHPDLIESIWVGDEMTTDIVCDLHITDDDLRNVDNAERIRGWLQEKGAIFKFW